MLSEAPVWREPNLHIVQELADQKVSVVRYFMLQFLDHCEGDFWWTQTATTRADAAKKRTGGSFHIHSIFLKEEAAKTDAIAMIGVKARANLTACQLWWARKKWLDVCHLIPAQAGIQLSNALVPCSAWEPR